MSKWGGCLASAQLLVYVRLNGKRRRISKVSVIFTLIFLNAPHPDAMPITSGWVYVLS